MRKLRDWTQTNTANALGISLSQYQAYEDKRSEPGIKILIKIADLYKITIDRLLREDMQEDIDLKEFERLKKKLKKK